MSNICVVVAFVYSQVMLTRKPVVQQIGNRDEVPRGAKHRGMTVRESEHLKQRVDLHELNAGALVDLVPRDDAEHALRNTIGAGIAVVNRILNESAGFVQQCEVDAPGIHAYAFDVTGPRETRLASHARAEERPNASFRLL